jgi:hypothetical protein
MRVISKDITNQQTNEITHPLFPVFPGLCGFQQEGIDVPLCRKIISHDENG